MNFGSLGHRLPRHLVMQAAAAELAAAVCITGHFGNHWSKHGHVGTWNDALGVRGPDLLSETVLNLPTPCGVTRPQWVLNHPYVCLLIIPDCSSSSIFLPAIFHGHFTPKKWGSHLSAYISKLIYELLYFFIFYIGGPTIAVQWDFSGCLLTNQYGTLSSVFTMNMILILSIHIYVDCVLCTKTFVNTCLYMYMSSFNKLLWVESWEII